MINKKSLVFTVLLVVLAAFLMSSVSYAQPSVTVTASKKSFKPGDTGFLIIKFKGSKIKIPKEPPIDVTINGDNIIAQGLQDYSGGSGDYIDSKQVKFKFRISENAPSGTISVSGNIKFGYCSSDSGICKLGNKSFNAKVKVK